jgi:hypothetical protein
MFQRIRTYQLIHMGGQSYRPRAYGDPQPAGTWDGWLVFFPMIGGPAIASNRETTQSAFGGLTRWAAGVTPVYLEGALARALEIELQPSVIGQLNAAEYELLEDAEAAATEAVVATEAAEFHEEVARGERAVAADGARRSRQAQADAIRATRTKRRSQKKSEFSAFLTEGQEIRRRTFF